ncbi:MAG: histidine phosphatase family protein [Lysobacterales bacterium]
MKHRLLVLLTVVFLFACAATPPADTVTLYLIRHAETVSSSVNPDRPLNPEGLQRAAWLGEHFANLPVDQLYSTNITRTLQTIAPVARSKSLTINHYNPGELEPFADELRQLSGPALVAGHSNTTPALLNALERSNNHEQIDDAEHGLIFIVHMLDGEVHSVDVERSEP